MFVVAHDDAVVILVLFINRVALWIRFSCFCRVRMCFFRWFGWIDWIEVIGGIS